MSSTRLRDLLVLRVNELLDEQAPIGRRARTLSTRTAARELHQLTTLMIPSHHPDARPASESAAETHGSSLRPNVAAEALQLLSDDLALKSAPSLRDGLQRTIKALSHETASFTRANVEELRAFIGTLQTAYIDLCIDEMKRICLDSPRELLNFEELLEQLTADLRDRGWTDRTLLEVFRKRIEEFPEVVDILSAIAEDTKAPPRAMRCLVPLDTNGSQSTLRFAADRFRRIDPPDSPDCSDLGAPCIEVTVLGVDSRAVAAEARMRVASVLGAASVFSRDALGPNGTQVVVYDNETRHIIDTQAALRREPHNARPGELERIVASTLASLEGQSSDPLSDAIRHHQRARDVQDLESRYMLLWSGIERLCASPGATMLASVRAYIPKSLALGKVRRDISSLADEIGRTLWGADGSGQDHADLRFVTPAGRATLKHDLLLGRILGSETESRTLTTTFYEKDPRLVQWYCRLRRALRGQEGSDIHNNVAVHIEQSRKRAEWQVLRLYRARNWVAHGGGRPSWLLDLTKHADYYLTNLIAIAVHYRESAPQRSPSEIFATRHGQYDAYQALLQSGDRRACQVPNLLRPTGLVAG